MVYKAQNQTFHLKNKSRLFQTNFLMKKSTAFSINYNYHYKCMLQRASKIIQQFSSRSQNFFDIKPIFPDPGDRQFQVYNTARLTIPVLEEYKKLENRDQVIKKQVRNKFFLRNNMQNINQNEPIIDPQTKLIITQHKQLNEYIQQFKKQKHIGMNLKHQFDHALKALMKRFQAKSQTQLIRMLKISIAHTQKQDIKQKIRGMLLQKAILMYVQSNPEAGLSQQQIKNKVAQNIDDQKLDEVAFRAASNEIEQKIAKIQRLLKYNNNGINKTLSQYDPTYGWKPLDEQYVNQNYSLITRKGSKRIKAHRNYPKPRNLQDWSIEQKISRLYFLQRIRYSIEKNDDYFNTIKPNFELRKTDRLINELALKYKQKQLQIIPDIEDIYRQIDIAIDKIKIKLTTSKQQPDSGVQSRRMITQRLMRSEDLIWQNLDVDNIFTPQYMQDEIIKQKQLATVSSSADVQLSLNKLPINLYRHQELENLGIFNKYRYQILKDSLKEHYIEPKIGFKQFSIEQAKDIYQKKKDEELEKNIFRAEAKRKKAWAKVALTQGNGKVTVNGKPLKDHYYSQFERVQALKPLLLTKSAGKVDLQIQVIGSGFSGGPNACAFAISRALIKFNPQHKTILQKYGFTGFDGRVKQAKKLGKYSARVSPPYVRR